MLKAIVFLSINFSIITSKVFEPCGNKYGLNFWNDSCFQCQPGQYSQITYLTDGSLGQSCLDCPNKFDKENRECQPCSPYYEFINGKCWYTECNSTTYLVNAFSTKCVKCPETGCNLVPRRNGYPYTSDLPDKMPLEPTLKEFYFDKFKKLNDQHSVSIRLKNEDKIISDANKDLDTVKSIDPTSRMNTFLSKVGYYIKLWKASNERYNALMNLPPTYTELKGDVMFYVLNKETESTITEKLNKLNEKEQAFVDYAKHKEAEQDKIKDKISNFWYKFDRHVDYQKEINEFMPKSKDIQPKLESSHQQLKNYQEASEKYEQLISQETINHDAVKFLQ